MPANHSITNVLSPKCWTYLVILNLVTAWIVAVAWIVAGDNSCRCSRHKSSPATIHAVSVSMNCRRRQFIPEISLMLCTSPATIHAAWKKIIGIYCRRRHILMPPRPIFIYFLGHRSQRLQWPIVITRCPSSVVRRPSSVVRRLSSVVRRLSSVCRPLDYLHFQLLLQNRLMDFDETWYGWSTQGPLQVLLFFGPIRPGADPGRGKNRSRGVPFFRKLLLQTGRLQQQTECIVVI